MRRNVKVQHVVGAVAVGALLITAQSAVAGPAGVSASNHHTARSAAVRRQSVKVMTYDIRDLSSDGTPEGSGDIAPWSKRAPKQAALIRQSLPDVIAIQEGSSFVGNSTTERQVDSLRDAIGGSYRVALTEIPPPQPHSFRTGDYIIFRSSTFKPVGKGAHFSIGDNKFAVYQEFASRKTHARFLFAATHLLVGLGHSDDLSRQAEAKRMLTTMGKIAKRRHVPVIYAGNFNAPNPSVGSGKAMRQAHERDVLAVARTRTDARYNSDNEYLRTPPHDGVDIDHIYARARIKIASAGIVIDLRHGRFVGPIPSDHNPLVARLLYPY